MADNVVKFNDSVKIKHEPNPKAIELVEKVLEEMKRGEIISIAICYTQEDGSTGHATSISDAPGAQTSLVGALMRTVARLSG